MMPVTAKCKQAIPGADRRRWIKRGQPHRTLSFGTVVKEWKLVAGAAMVEDLPAGKWVVRIAGPNGKSWQGEVMAVAGGSVRKEL